MWNDVRKTIDAYDSFLITSHINPDGDAIGSEVALRSYINDLDKHAVVVNSSPTPDSLAFLDPDNEIRVFGDGVGKEILDEIDAVFILDVNNWEHIGQLGRVLQNDSRPRVCIDHHQGPDGDFADVIVSDTAAAATGILVYEMIRDLGGRITRTISDAVYAALITDTGNFRFSNTNARAFRVAAELCDLGLVPFDMHRQVYGSKSWGAARLMGPVMTTVDSASDGRLAWISATRDMIDASGATYDDMDGYVDLIRSVKGVELVLFFKETADGHIKVSLRSNGKVDAFAIAEHFGGGGHRMASGMRVDGPMERAIEEVVRVCRQMDGVKAPAD